MVSKNKKLSPLEKNILYNFLLIRTVQLEMIRRYHPSDKMRCPMHFCTGQEIMPSAISPYMKKMTQYTVIIVHMVTFYPKKDH